MIPDSLWCQKCQMYCFDIFDGGVKSVKLIPIDTVQWGVKKGVSKAPSKEGAFDTHLFDMPHPLAKVIEEK